MVCKHLSNHNPANGARGPLVIDRSFNQRFPSIWGSFPEHTEFLVGVRAGKNPGDKTLVAHGYGSFPVAPGQDVLIPIRVTYPDGSSEVVTIPVSAVKPPHLGQTQPVADDAAGSSVSWLPIVLGAVAALAGAGYAAFINQDSIKRLLSQYGINI